MSKFEKCAVSHLPAGHPQACGDCDPCCGTKWPTEWMIAEFEDYISTPFDKAAGSRFLDARTSYRALVEAGWRPPHHHEHNVEVEWKLGDDLPF